MKRFKIFSIVVSISAFLFSNCKKTSNEPEQYFGGDSTYFYFDYNGQTYNRRLSDTLNTISDCFLEFNEKSFEAIGLAIEKPDVFGGKIIFHVPDCAYLIPLTGWRVQINDTGCVINTYGQAFDSSLLYFYKSGSFTYTTSNYMIKHYVDPETLVRYSITQYYYTGGFALTLDNKKGDTIDLKNGSFKVMQLFKRYE